MDHNTNACSSSVRRMENSIINSTTTSFSKMKINDGEGSATITFRDIQLKHLERKRKEFFTEFNQISTNSNISKPFRIIPTFSTIKKEFESGYIENETRPQSPMDISEDETSIVSSCGDKTPSSSTSLSDGASSHFRIPIPIKDRAKNISNLKINNINRRCNKVVPFSRLQSKHFKNVYREFMENDGGMIFINLHQKQRSIIRIQHDYKRGEISIEGSFLPGGKTDMLYNSNNNENNKKFKFPEYPLERHTMKISISKSQFHFISDTVIKKSHSDEFELRIHPNGEKNVFNKKVGDVEYVDVDNCDTVYSLTKPPAFSF